MSVRGSVARFTAAGLVVTAALAGLTGVLAQRAGEHEATRSAERVARVVSTGVVAPLLSPGLVDGAAADQTRLADTVRPVLASGPVVRVKVWNPRGTLVWSDEPRLVGRTFPIDDELQEALDSGRMVSGITDLTQPENVYERGRGRLLEAYVPVAVPGVGTLVVEVYQSYDAVAAAAGQAWWSFAPAALGALVLLQLVQVPFAWRLARRVRRHQQAEATLLRTAVDASRLERRRIARDVHDGVVQDLTGITFDLDAARLGGLDGDDAPALISHTAGGLRRVVTELRRLLVDLSPPPLPTGGLGVGLQVLATGLQRQGCTVQLSAEGAGELPPAAAAMLYRCALEAVRNVAAHSAAEHVEITLRRAGRTVTLVVADDGVGFDEARLAERSAAGHLGLRALTDLLGEAGGSLSATSAPGRGTRLVATIPLPAAADTPAPPVALAGAGA